MVGVVQMLETLVVLSQKLLFHAWRNEHDETGIDHRDGQVHNV